MEKVEIIKIMADSILESDNRCITTDEFEKLISLSQNQEETDLYVNLYNFFLKKRSEEVIKNGKI